MKELKITIREQECNKVGYEFGNNIPILMTRALYNELSEFETMTPHQIIGLSLLQLFKERKNQNIDYIQVFDVIENENTLTFWAISNQEINEPFSQESNVTFLLPSDY